MEIVNAMRSCFAFCQPTIDSLTRRPVHRTSCEDAANGPPVSQSQIRKKQEEMKTNKNTSIAVFVFAFSLVSKINSPAMMTSGIKLHHPNCAESMAMPIMSSITCAHIS